MELPFQNHIAESLLSKLDINALLKDAIAKLDSKQIAQMLIDSFKAEITHLQAQDPAHPGMTYLDEAGLKAAEIEKDISELFRLVQRVKALK
ncbi:MAG: hypothetical protein KGI50_07515 [Patescibacteria group bacterium]|nr:hypothetical protein [Patescibacteria group bacterium]